MNYLNLHQTKVKQTCITDNIQLKLKSQIMHT